MTLILVWAKFTHCLTKNPQVTDEVKMSRFRISDLSVHSLTVSILQWFIRQIIYSAAFVLSNLYWLF